MLRRGTLPSFLEALAPSTRADLLMKDAPTTTPAGLRAAIEPLHEASFGWAMACCGRSRADAEDVLHSAYAKVLSGEAMFDGRASFKTWLFGVIRRTASEQRRGAILRWLRLSRAHDEPAPPPSPEQVTDDRARARELTVALHALSERQRQVLHLVFYQSMTVREAADAMGVSAGTASLHYDRGKQRLAELLERRGVGP
jgi:RNA polymerase sigma factor (sigma-70 family)